MRDRRGPVGSHAICSSSSLYLRSKEKRQVLRQQHILIENDLPPRDQPTAAVLTHGVLTFADEEIGFRLHTVAIDQEPRLDGNLARHVRISRHVKQLHVRHHVGYPRSWLLRPMDAGLDLAYAAGQRVLALI